MKTRKSRIILRLVLPVVLLLSVSFGSFAFFPNYGLDGNNPQNQKDEDKYNKGITVSPAHLEYSVDVGQSKTQKIKISNFSDKVRKFKVEYNDFDMGKNGKSSFLEAGESKYSLAKYLNIAPSFVELKPGTSATVSVTVEVPSDEEDLTSTWGVIMIQQVEEKKSLDPGNKTGNTVAFGITPTIAFGVWIYQNPSNVEISGVEIRKYVYETDDDSGERLLFLNIENTGDGISRCKTYIEMTNLGTGEQKTLGGKTITVLPGYKRDLIFKIPDDLPKGKYSTIGVVDYGSDTELVAAEMEITVN